MHELYISVSYTFDHWTVYSSTKNSQYLAYVLYVCLCCMYVLEVENNVHDIIMCNI